MGDQWYYAQNGQQVGPVPTQSLQALVTSGQLRPEDLVWQEGLPNWIEACQAPEIFPIGTTPTLNYQRPLFAHEFVYAGFWLRFTALILDALILGVGLGILVGILRVLAYTMPGAASDVVGTIAYLGGHASVWIYFAATESSPWQATLGKRAVGLKVTSMQGERITFGRATGRHFAKFLSAMMVYVGFMMAGWTQRKQGLHDIVASTLVVRR
jgi:uncharacterized RDD family membrane protein YckC